jgi:ABC transport system ATP-binding/permease protein
MIKCPDDLYIRVFPMALISLQSASLGFGGPFLLENVNLQIEPGERVGLLGRNGMGKTTLLKLVCGELEPNEGLIIRQQNLRLAYLPQEIPFGLTGPVVGIVAAGLEGAEAGGLQPELEEEPWQRQLVVEKVISRMQLDPAASFQSLSAGLKRRVLLARGLVCDPDLLLLDEPTNHLDIASITWLEDFLARWSGSLLFVTHDRAFLQRLASRIVELDRGRLYDWRCDYPTFLRRRDALLAAEGEQSLLFDKKLAQEEAWIRRGIEARRTRNEGRVRALQKLRELRRQRREQPAQVRLQIQEARRSGKLVIEAGGIGFAYGEKPVVRDFSTTILRGDRVGIIGPNGSGKTTLLRLLIGDLPLHEGTLRLGANLEIAYFDQLRGKLDESKTVMENVGEGRDFVTINGKTRNIVGYIGDFLFPPDRIHVPIHILSGGERNRLLLARLFTRPANLLVLDEPTNDLDIETLELLESMLMEYGGTLLLVSHDRAFLNNLVTSTLVLSGGGQVDEYIGGYDDYLRQSQSEAEARPSGNAENRPVNAPVNKTSPPARTESPQPESRKLTFKELGQLEPAKRELAEMPHTIERLEAEIQQLSTDMADPAFYQRDESAIARSAARLKELEEQIDEAYQRWEELENFINRE